jgi:hypothetical protein
VPEVCYAEPVFQIDCHRIDHLRHLVKERTSLPHEASNEALERMEECNSSVLCGD